MTTRVALFVPSLNDGGAQRVILNLAYGLNQQDIRTDLLVANHAGPYVSQIPTGVRLVALRGGSVLKSMPSLIRYLRSEQPFVLLSAMTHANIAALWARRFAGAQTRIVISEHTNLAVASQQDRRLKPQELFKPVLVRWSYHWADAIVAVSQGASDELQRFANLAAKKVTVIHNPIDTADIARKAGENPHHAWFRAPAPPVILGVGRLVPAKDFTTLMHAFYYLRSWLSSKLIILGEGSQRQRLQSLARDLGILEHVDMPGFVQNPYAFMRRASVLALSSAWEGFGNVLVEAMAVGTPVVSTDCMSGPREILQGGEYGRLVPVGDARALADAILQTIANPVAPEILRTRSELFSVQNVTQAYLRVLDHG